MGAIAVAASVAAVGCVAPIVLVLASFIGLVPFDYGLLLIAIPTAGIAVLLAVIARTAISDLLLPHPVLVVSEEGLVDRRVADRPIRWNEVTAAISLIDGRGGVVLELTQQVRTRLEPFRPGTFLFERPDPGIAHIPVRAMTREARDLADAILRYSANAGATTAEASSHPRAQRRRIM